MDEELGKEAKAAVAGLGIVAGFFAFCVVAFFALLSGTLLFWLWPNTIPVVFPGLVSSGVLVANIPWKTAVFLTWIVAILRFRLPKVNKTEIKAEEKKEN